MERTFSGKPEIRALREADLPDAERVFRRAFGAYRGLSDPLSYTGDANRTKTRFRIDPEGAFAATVEGRLAAVLFAAGWGSFGYFGPLAVEPALWNAGVGRLLIDAAMELFTARGHTLTGLYTMPESPKHLALYGRYGYLPRFLSEITEKSLGGPAGQTPSFTRLSTLAPEGRNGAETALADLTGSFYEGLDLTSEARGIVDNGLGDALMLEGSGGVEGMALCHVGPGTEAPGGTLFVKFSAVRKGRGGGRVFGALVRAWEGYARERGLIKVAVTVNTSHPATSTVLKELGYVPRMHGVQMVRPNTAGFDRPGIHLTSDWR